MQFISQVSAQAGRIRKLCFNACGCLPEDYGDMQERPGASIGRVSVMGYYALCEWEENKVNTLVAKEPGSGTIH